MASLQLLFSSPWRGWQIGIGILQEAGGHTLAAVLLLGGHTDHVAGTDEAHRLKDMGRSLRLKPWEMHSHLHGTWTSVRPNHVATACWPPHL